MANCCSLDSLPVDKTIIDFLKKQTDIIIDKYSSKGGNGELFFGLNKILHKRVALKFYYYGQRDAPHEEARILSKVRDRNILEVLDGKVISKDYAYFLTPEVEGGDLDEFIQMNNKEVFKAIKIVRGILRGLTVLHTGNRLVHRDLKPGNILVDSAIEPLIADFGSVKIIPSSSDLVKASQHTILYRPPEAFHSNSYYFKSDLYQVGILLYQLLGGYFPYNEAAWLNKKEKKEYSLLDNDYGKSKYIDNIIRTKACSGRLIDFDSLPFFICRRLRSIIKTSTNVDLDKRYQNTSEFMRDIHTFMSTSVNWCVQPDSVVAIRPNIFKFRLIKNGKKIIVQKRYGKIWRRYNKINGTLEDIAEQINSYRLS